jgi:hypothetical protein
MTVTDNVQAMSGYTVGTNCTITTTELAIFQAWAESKVSRDGVTANTDEAIALLICHYISRKSGESGKVSESIGKYSYTRAISSGASEWMDEYNRLLRNNQTYLVKVNR